MNSQEDSSFVSSSHLRSHAIHKPREKTEYERMIEIQTRLFGRGATRSSASIRKIESAFKYGGDALPKVAAVYKMDPCDQKQRRILNFMVDCIKDHKFCPVLEKSLNKEVDLTVEDLGVIIKKDKINVVTGEEQGLANFETVISCYFDTIDTRLRDFYNYMMLSELEKAKQEYMELSVKEITTDLGKLTMNDREEIYKREEFKDIIKIDRIFGERKLELTKGNLDKIIVF